MMQCARGASLRGRVAAEPGGASSGADPGGEAGDGEELAEPPSGLSYTWALFGTYATLGLALAASTGARLSPATALLVVSPGQPARPPC